MELPASIFGLKISFQFRGYYSIPLLLKNYILLLINICNLFGYIKKCILQRTTKLWNWIEKLGMNEREKGGRKTAFWNSKETEKRIYLVSCIISGTDNLVMLIKHEMWAGGMSRRKEGKYEFKKEIVFSNLMRIKI